MKRKTQAKSLYFIEHGAKLNHRNIYGETPFHLAARWNARAVLELMLRKGVPPNVRGGVRLPQGDMQMYVEHVYGKGGYTAIHAVLQMPNAAESLPMLVELGVDIDARDGSGRTALDIVLFGYVGHRLAPVLLALGATVSDAQLVFLLGPGSPSREDPLASPVLAGKKLKRATSKGVAKNTPMHQAARMGYVASMEILLRSGFSLETRDAKGWTPLMVAAGQGPLAGITWLLDHGAAIDTVGPHGGTALHIACEVDDLPAVKLLIDRGAKADRKTKDGLTPLDVAKAAERQAIIGYLSAR